MAKQFSVNVKGIDAVLKKFDGLSGSKIEGEIEKVTETYARKMANDSAAIAPRLTGQLRNSITASPKKVRRGVWQWGSNLAYAQRQEYENASHKGFVRKTVWANREAYREAVRKRITEEAK